jgi:peroxiredoxin
MLSVEAVKDYTQRSACLIYYLGKGRCMTEPGAPVPMVKPADRAEDFTLKDQKDQAFELRNNGGKRTLLSFHPLAWTSFCEGQMKSLEKNHEIFSSLNTVAVGISVDSVPCKKAWAEHLKISKTRLLSDFWPHGGVAQRYDIFNQEAGTARRSNIIVDETMMVRFVKVYPTLSLPDIEEVIAVLKTL